MSCRMLTVRCDGSTPLLHVKMHAVICKGINGHASSYDAYALLAAGLQAKAASGGLCLPSSRSLA